MKNRQVVTKRENVMDIESDVKSETIYMCCGSEKTAEDSDDILVRI